MRSVKMAAQFLQTQGGKIAYDETGSGPLVICVPSMGDVRGEYRFLAPLLAQAGCRVLSMDVRGHGESSTEWSDFSVAGVGSDIIALIRSLNAGPAVIIGTSMAAGAAVWAAAEAPEQVSGMVLIGAFVRGDGGGLLSLLFSLMAMRPWGPVLWLKYYSTLYPTHKPADFADYTAALKANLKAPGRVEALGAMLRASKRASEDRLPRVKAPALVVMGSKDPDFPNPESEAKWVADALHTTYTMVEGAGHYPHAEMPDKAFDLILPFLQQIHAQPEAAHA
jgi:pimeloyl-ACP methyl ester carboxylesterase